MRVLSLVFAILTLYVTGCVTTLDSDVEINPSVKQDSDYKTALQNATRDRKIFDNFETKYLVTATYLSPAFKTAFAKRIERVYKQDYGRFDETSGKAGFFIAIHAPETERIDLANPAHWSVFLESKGGMVKPVIIKKINDKERWRAFFPSVSEWTTEYLIVFDTPAVDTSSTQVVEKLNLALTLANADAQVRLEW